MNEEALMGSYVGIDLHRQRSVVVVLNGAGERVSWSRIDNTAANATQLLVDERLERSRLLEDCGPVAWEGEREALLALYPDAAAGG